LPRYKLTLAYDGTDFCGWQKQFPHADAVPSAPRLTPDPSEGPRVDEGSGRERVELRTVQGVVERAVREVVREVVDVYGASRTDSGVHANGQVCAFTSLGEGGGVGWPAERGTEPLMRALNARLPGDVLVTAAELVPDAFDPVGDCDRKAYSYTIWTGQQRPLWERRRVLHVWQALDAAAMDAAARVVVGGHDFAAFAAAGHGRATTVRTVYECSVRRTGETTVRMDIVGSGFLWNMVRIIAGTLVEIGKGRLGEGDVRAALETGDRRRAGPTLPGHGLCLEWIRYRQPSTTDR
jgi:tRNA pseudouridine38-40 synthase